jgi:hypothetical protein
MRYDQFEDRIRQMVTAAPADARYRFALQTITLLLAAAELAIQEELSESERACSGRSSQAWSRAPRTNWLSSWTR